MRRIHMLALMVVISTGSTPAQDRLVKDGSGMNKFHSFNTIHFLNGSSTTSLALNSVNGIQFGNFFCGIGTGFDYYYHVSLPLFIETRMNLVKRKGALQFFVNGGLNFPFATRNKKLENRTGKYKTGTCYAAGLDYVFPVKNEGFILGLAFSNKQTIQKVDNNIWNPVLNRIENIPFEDKYSLNRIAIRAGWMF
ncbi:MAG: hypothetical protein WKI04_03280 [Ferruginibacter sp.]